MMANYTWLVPLLINYLPVDTQETRKHATRVPDVKFKMASLSSKHTTMILPKMIIILTVAKLNFLSQILKKCRKLRHLRPAARALDVGHCNNFMLHGLWLGFVFKFFSLTVPLVILGVMY